MPAEALLTEECVPIMESGPPGPASVVTVSAARRQAVMLCRHMGVLCTEPHTTGTQYRRQPEHLHCVGVFVSDTESRRTLCGHIGCRMQHVERGEAVWRVSADAVRIHGCVARTELLSTGGGLIGALDSDTECRRTPRHWPTRAVCTCCARRGGAQVK